MTDVIDIGSNSVRLLSHGKKTAIVTRLAENMTDSLDKNSMDRTVEALKRLCSLATMPCLAFATEAVRKANNKDEFLEIVKQNTGLTVDVISGDEEAEIGYLGATYNIFGKATVIDLGGASCEIAYGENGKIKYKRSFPFGCVTMTDAFGDDLFGIKRHVASVLDMPNFNAKTIAVGGTATSLAAIAQNLPYYDQLKVHGYKMEVTDIGRVILEIIDGKEFPSLDPKRRKTLAQGAVVLKTLAEKLDIKSFTISETDNMEGYLIKKGLF